MVRDSCCPSVPLALGLLGVLALSACTSSPPEPASETTVSAPAPASLKPSSPAGTSPSASAAPTDSLAPPRPPRALREVPSITGAIAVSEYFLALFPYTAKTGDFRLWDELSDPKCEFCSGTRKQIAELVRSGVHSEGGAVSISKSHGRENASGFSYTALIEFSQDESRDVDDDGVVKEVYQGVTRFSAEVVLHWENGRWSVREVDVAELP
jgi:hypothetical protein